MATIDYNGEGRWSAIEILSRYAEYAASAQITPRDLSPGQAAEHGHRWVYPVMDEVIKGIHAGDPACIEIGIEFIEEDRGLAFGRILKSNTARALRRVPLSRDQQDRILRRVFDMFRRGYIPRELRDYARLARSIGFSAADVPPVAEAPVYVMRYHRYLLAAASKDARR